jgi:hypothetical protein
MSAGIYLMTYRGAAGWGQGLIVLRAGKVTGADAAGGLYDGTYDTQPKGMTFDLTLTVPPGVVLVQGTQPQPTTYAVPFKAFIPYEAIEKEQPVLVSLPPGPVNAIVKRLRALGD